MPKGSRGEKRPADGVGLEQEALPDRPAFGPDAERWEAFLVALDAPVRPMPRLGRLLGESSVFE